MFYPEEEIERVLPPAFGGKEASLLSEEEVRDYIAVQRRLEADRLRGSIRDLRHWIESGKIDKKTADCVASVGMLILEPDLRRRQSTLPPSSDYFEPRLARYGRWRSLRTSDFLYLENAFSQSLATGFLVGMDTVLTANHLNGVSMKEAIGDRSLLMLFDFECLGDSRPRHVFSWHHSVFRVVEMVKCGEEDLASDDWILLRLDRSPTATTGRPWLPWAPTDGTSAPIFTLGHSKGLPMRYASAPSFDSDSQPGCHRAFVDAYKGASGSPVIHATNFNVIGMVTGAASPEHQEGKIRTTAGDHVSTVCTPQTSETGALFISTAKI